mgnify:FL=1
MEVLLHIGLDTVEMKGDGFEALVKAGDRVDAGDCLIRFSRDKIKAAGHPDMVIMVVTSPGTASSIDWKSGIHARAGKDPVALLECV